MVRRRGLPEINELVVVRTYKVTQFAAWCKLEEYPEMEGMISISEAAGKWIYDVREVVKEGKQYVAKVMKIEPDRKMVRLSLKRVSKREQKEKMNVFRKEQRAEKILELMAKKLGRDLDEAYEKVGFLLQEEFGEMYDGLEEIFKNPQILEKLKIPDEWKEVLIEVVKKSFKEKVVELKAEIELYSLEGDGVRRIREVLDELVKKGLTVKYISPPKYLVKLTTAEPKRGERNLEEALERVKKLAKKLGCFYSFRVSG